MANYQKHSLEQWQVARDAIALGSSVAQASKASGISCRRINAIAAEERWPRPSEISNPTTPAAQAAALTLAQRGEAHRAKIASLVEQALAKAIPPALESWADIERAHKLGLDAFGLNQAQAPLVSIAFPTSPALHSTEAPSIIDISTNHEPLTDAGTSSLESYPLPP